jgi:hypothetical protein
MDIKEILDHNLDHSTVNTIEINQILHKNFLKEIAQISVIILVKKA